jgi:hypothetical protein
MTPRLRARRLDRRRMPLQRRSHDTVRAILDAAARIFAAYGPLEASQVGLDRLAGRDQRLPHGAELPPRRVPVQTVHVVDQGARGFLEALPRVLHIGLPAERGAGILVTLRLLEVIEQLGAEGVLEAGQRAP